ncbi:unnamed protein product [Euphydryas editha]|uniref:Uncharacterized protein n=1 Tax=Euphydryas editha TaxID=104508 RepID=A0AAU9U6M2_EUPED|nr:unnamed protein product [Euphydryas editha]
MRCATKEDMIKISLIKDLAVRKPSNQDPMVCVQGVLLCYCNEEIKEHIKAQNGYILYRVDRAGLQMKVRFRKRTRNSNECHPILEKSPEFWKRLTQAQKIYVGFGHCSVENQSALIQCIKCVGYGHTKALCKEKNDLFSYCGGKHMGRHCPSRAKNETPHCVNCSRAKKGVLL